MYVIARYFELYNPTNSSGGKLKNATYVKYPVKPRGKGLRALLKKKDGAAILGIWGLLLQAATETTKPDLRGRLLNHKDEAASVEEIADSISFENQIERVRNALKELINLGWVEDVTETEEEQNESVLITETPPPKVKVKEIEDNQIKPKEKEKPLDFNLTEESIKKLFSDELKPETGWELNTLNKLARDCYERKASLPNMFTYLIDEIADLKENCKVKKKNHGDLMRMAVKSIKKKFKIK